MKFRPILLITLICILPLTMLTWAALRMAEGEQLLVRQQFRDLLEERLHDLNVDVANYFASLERELDQTAAIDDFNPELLRAICRNSPRLLQLFVIAPDGLLEYPDPRAPLNNNERSFLIQAAQMFTGQDLQSAVLRAEQSQTGRTTFVDMLTLPTPDTNKTISDEPRQQTAVDETVRNAYQSATAESLVTHESTSGWFIWYWDRGINLIYWQRRPSGHIVGCALDRARWISELIAMLPTTSDDLQEPGRSLGTTTLSTQVRLVNASAEVVYQWGSYDPPPSESPFSEQPLAEPLTAWRLQYFAPTARLLKGTGETAQFSAIASLLAVATVMGFILYLFINEYSRDMREAALQVTFVNQVSHELRTPLTNIQMYAELLERDIDRNFDANNSALRQRLDVILAESQRLGRLIANVLTFARGKNKTLQLQLRQIIPDNVMQATIDRIRPTLEALDVDIQLNFRAQQTMHLDSDILEQIVCNLLSNVEKYASQGRYLSVTTSVSDASLIVDVEDHGPGIPAQFRASVFQPFVRISSDLSYAAGTGIGLTISRDLARLHGGDVVLMDSLKGCWFRATLKQTTSASNDLPTANSTITETKRGLEDAS